MRVLVLGPVELVGMNGPVHIAGSKTRALLAMLALSANQHVSEGRLIDGLWGDEPPRTAGKIVQNLVLRLRKALAVAAVAGLSVETRPGGYTLVVASDDLLDLAVLDAIVGDARRASIAGEAKVAAQLVSDALALWRGEALTEFRDCAFAAPEIVRLGEIRKHLTEESFHCELELGHHHDCVADLEALTAEDPLRERLWHLRMLALYRCGRPSEALRAYQEIRHLMVEELGLEPTSGLVALELAILSQDPGLDWRSGRLPTGTVAFLFSSLSNLTALRRPGGEDFGTDRRVFHRAMRSAIQGSGGTEIRADRDTFIAAFANPNDAVLAALSAGQTVQAMPAVDAAGVGMSLHIGEATAMGGDYICLATHQAERLARSAHRGQILASAAFAGAVAETLAPPTSLRDIGVHQLRDFPTAEPVYQLCHPDLAENFPALRTPSRVAHNLPHARTSFIGRSQDMGVVLGLLEGPGVVTVVGPGGVGKTRIAVEAAFEAASRYPDGVWLVDLALLSDPDLVPAAVAEVLRVHEEVGRFPLDVVAEVLRDRSALLVVDNCEHLVVAAAQLVDTLTSRCPRLAILATSREPLRVDGEAVWRLAPLRVPSSAVRVDPDKLSGYDAVRLFVERAALAAPGFALDADNAESISAITVGLDGIPLALELAAARVGELTTGQIAASLDGGLALRNPGRRAAPPRQQTMEAAIAWSYDLLADDECSLLRNLAVFAGGFSLEAAIAVCSEPSTKRSPADALARLAAKSLLAIEGGDIRRFRMLETVRDFARRKLDAAGEAAACRSRHLQWVLTLIGDAHCYVGGPEETRWVDAIGLDEGNIREALRYALAAGAGEAALVLATKAACFWDIRGYLAEGRDWLEKALANAPGAPKLLRADGLVAMGSLLAQFDSSRARALREQAVALLRGAGDRQRLGRALSQLAYDELFAGTPGAARACLVEALTLLREVGDGDGVGLALGLLAGVARSEGAIGEERRLTGEAIELHRAHGNLRELAWSLGDLGALLERLGDHPGALAALEESKAMHHRLGHPQGEAWAACGMAQAALSRGDLVAARAGFEEALSVQRELGLVTDSQWALAGLGEVSLGEGDLQAARLHFEENLRQHLSRAGAAGSGLAAVFHHLGMLAMAEGRDEEGTRLLAGSAELRQSAGNGLSSRDMAAFDRALAKAQARLDPRAFARAWRDGSSFEPCALVEQVLGRRQQRAGAA